MKLLRICRSVALGAFVASITVLGIKLHDNIDTDNWDFLYPILLYTEFCFLNFMIVERNRAEKEAIDEKL